MMENKDLDKLLIEATAPHLAEARRRVKGCPEGSLKCNICGSMKASKNRQRTAYVNSDNMDTLCPSCQQEADAYWNDMWSEYYSSVM